MESGKKKEKFDNKMREIKIEKLILNLCTGESGDKLTKAAKVLRATMSSGSGTSSFQMRLISKR